MTSMKDKLIEAGIVTQEDAEAAVEREKKRKEDERIKKAQEDYEAAEKLRVKREIDNAWWKHRYGDEG